MIFVFVFLACAIKRWGTPEQVDAPEPRCRPFSINYLDRSDPDRPYLSSYTGCPTVSYSQPEPSIVDAYLLGQGNLPYYGQHERQLSGEEASKLLQGLELYGAWTVESEIELNKYPLEQEYSIFLSVGDKSRRIRLSRENPDNSGLLRFIRSSVIGRIKASFNTPGTGLDWPRSTHLLTTGRVSLSVGHGSSARRSRQKDRCRCGRFH